MAQSDIETTVTKLRAEFDTMATLIGRHADSDNGKASDSWQQTRHKWHAATEELDHIVSAVGRAVTEAAERHQGTEGKSTGMWV